MSDAKESLAPADWHAKSIEEIFTILQTSAAGLSEDDVGRRLLRYGLNKLDFSKRRSALMRFLAQFHNLLIYLLLCAAGITFFLGKNIDMAVILSVVIVNALIGFFQEGRAERSIDAVSRMLSLQAVVIRNRKRFVISAEKLVLGDIVVLQSGDKVPADLRLFEIKNLKVSEAILTGESEPVEKKNEVLPPQKIINDRINMAFSSTLVTYGQAYGVVVETGVNTEVGKIGALLSQVTEITTPLMRKIAVFSRWLTAFILALSGFVISYGFFVHSYEFEMMLMIAVGLAVAAIPEGLAIILTVTLAIGVQRMARCHAIIRRLPAVETLGSVMIICTDKTGTLTQNEMMAQKICIGGKDWQITGSGYDQQGEFYLGDQIVDPLKEAALMEFCKAAMLCNEASFDAEHKLLGDPTDGALLALAGKARLEHDLLKKEFPETDKIPFESEYRFMATLHHDHAGYEFIYVKGAPEVVFKRCSMQRKNGEDLPMDIKYWQEQMNQLARMGLRTIALAYKPLEKNGRTKLDFEDVKNNLVLLGVVGLIDPPRNESFSSIQECHKAGIDVKMITGDYAVTAQAIADQIGINSKDVLTGEDFDALSDQELVERVEKTDVFARTSPEHKMRLVKALQSKGYIVAMTGDGVNDAPALKRADIGIAMGLKGTEAAKEASEMVLADDNFASIVEAVKQGRTVYDNLKKVFLFLLPINGGESLSLAVAILFGITLPILPLQVLWVNMVSSVMLAMALAFEPSEKGVMQRPPVSPGQAVLSKFLVWRIIFVSIVFLAGIFGVFELALWQGSSIEVARTLAVNTLVSLEVFYLFSSRYMQGFSFSKEGLRSAGFVTIAAISVFFLQLLFTFVPFMNFFFQTRALTLTQGLLVLAVGAVACMIMEMEKLLFLFFKNRN